MRLSTSAVEQALREGLSDKEMAERFHVTERAIKWHIAKLRHRAGLWGSGNQRRFMIWVLTEPTRAQWESMT